MHSAGKKRFNHVWLIVSGGFEELHSVTDGRLNGEGR
jgi:hypothetical protein